jgi:hypothetical protein
MPAIDDKGFWDVFNSIAPVALQLVGSLTKEYEAGGKAMNVQTVSVDIPSSADKGFWDYFNTIAPVALQVIGSLTGGKAFESNGSSGAASVTPSAAASGTLSVNDKGFWDVFNKVAPTVLHIVGQLTKSYDPGSKSFSTAASKAVVTIDDIPPASDKGFWDVVSSVARVAVPLIVSAL